MAYPSNDITTTANGKLKFNQIDRNDGQGYSASTGVFSAPVAGMYHFYWSLLLYSGNLRIDFKLNGAVKVYSYRHPGDGRYSSTTGAIYLRLKVGDQVYLEASQSGGIINGDRFSTFGGELIRH